MTEISPRTIATKSLSKLGAKLHVQMRIELRHLQQRMGTIRIYVTHDQTGAMGLSDRIMVMSKGLLNSLEPPMRSAAARRLHLWQILWKQRYCFTRIEGSIWKKEGSFIAFGFAHRARYTAPEDGKANGASKFLYIWVLTWKPKLGLANPL
jgi:ABC-type sulfate/molybdate transport systems ATPase subunit